MRPLPTLRGAGDWVSASSRITGWPLGASRFDARRSARPASVGARSGCDMPSVLSHACLEARDRSGQWLDARPLHDSSPRLWRDKGELIYVEVDGGRGRRAAERDKYLQSLKFSPAGACCKIGAHTRQTRQSSPVPVDSRKARGSRRKELRARPPSPLQCFRQAFICSIRPRGKYIALDCEHRAPVK